jgi:gamma-glutamyltranspeptidase
MIAGQPSLGSPHGQRSEAHRPVVMGRNGMVCSGHPLSSEAGVSVLRRGGNAIDAAIAIAAALGVVEPQASGIGGDGFIMVYERDSGADRPPGERIRVVNATGPAPQAATRNAYADGIPMTGIRSVSVPGLVDGWLEAHQRYGRLPLSTCLEPAIELAEGGFPVSHKLAAHLSEVPELMQFPTSREIFGPAGRPLRPGEILVQRDLARSLRTIGQEGRAAFYEGEIAHAVVATSERLGGLLDLDDLRRFHAQWQEPIATDYRGFQVYESPPNSSGHVLLQELNIIEELGVASLPPDSAEAIHLMVEAKRLAFADREAYMADPDWVDVPIEGLISKAYAAERARLIDPERAMTAVAAGDPWPHTGRPRREAAMALQGAQRGGDTTCFAVVDGEGNAVCQLQSIQSFMGSALVAEGTGILLNNRMTYWHLDPDHLDRLEPGKRVRHTMNTVMVFRGDDLVLVHGTPGADTQVQTNLQVLTHVLDHGFTVTEAVEAPRWRHVGTGTESTIPFGEADTLDLEARFPLDVVEGLRRLGHPVTVIGPWEGVGSEVAIQADPEHAALHGACDPRRDGYAVGF